jgi:hypothetical protein
MTHQVVNTHLEMNPRKEKNKMEKGQNDNLPHDYHCIWQLSLDCYARQSLHASSSYNQNKIWQSMKTSNMGFSSTSFLKCKNDL